MSGGQIVIVVGAIKVSWYHATKADNLLAVVCIAEFNARRFATA